MLSITSTFLIMIFLTGDLTIESIPDIVVPWEDFLKYVLLPPVNKLTLERLMAKRYEFHIDEEDFVGVGSHITLLGKILTWFLFKDSRNFVVLNVTKCK